MNEPALRIPRSVEVPLLDLKLQYQRIGVEIRAAIERVCASQHFILGEQVHQLEERIAAYCQTSYGVGVSSGTDALLVALMALDIGPGDEVITTPYSFFATGGVISRLGARPVFCDIDPLTCNLSPAAVRSFLETGCERRDGGVVNRATGGRIRALIPVHLYGQLADMGPLMDIAQRYGLRVIEDAAQAIGSADARGRRAGAFGDIACLSFFPSKNLGAFGDAGMCVTNDAELAERLRTLRVHGGKPKYHHAIIGGNFRLDEIQAAVLLVKLEHLDAWTAARQANAREYSMAFAAANLGDRLAPPTVADGHRHIYNQYVLRVSRRDELREHLRQAHIGTEIYYPSPLHLQPCFRNLGYVQGDFPEAERAARETLAIPVFPELSADQKRCVIETVIAFYSNLCG